MKHCPFCRSHGHLYRYWEGELYPGMKYEYYVKCSQKGCIANNDKSTVYTTKEAAVEAWNTRYEE